MFHPALPIGTQPIEPQAIMRRVNLSDEARHIKQGGYIVWQRVLDLALGS
jgi:hypothetical protein